MAAEAPREPTAKEIHDGATITHEGRTLRAAYYPQMGGYAGRCWVDLLGGGCFDVWIFHDGEFPIGDWEKPTLLHHCDAEQFIRFGELVKAMCDGSAD